MISALRAAGLSSFKSDFGIVTVAPKFSVRLPSNAADWDKLYTYLKEIGEYDGLRSINSQRLNAWYKAKLKEQMLDGNIDWCPPGLDEPTAIETLSIRKAHNV